MDHGVRVYDGVPKSAWESLQKKLKDNQEATARKLQVVHAERDFDVGLEKSDRRGGAEWEKVYKGTFSKPVDGIRTYSKLADDLIVCTPHLDITEAKQKATGGKLSQRYNPYKERKASAVNPGKYDHPFYLKWIPRQASGSLIILTPNGFSGATQHVLEKELLPMVGASVSETDSRLPRDPFRFLGTLDTMKRLGKIDSATVQLLDGEGNTVETATRVFREDGTGTLPNFRRWVEDRTGDAAAVALKSISLTVKLNDPSGKGFDLIVRPGENETPIGLQVSQKSELRTDAYQVVTNALKALLF